MFQHAYYSAFLYASNEQTPQGLGLPPSTNSNNSKVRSLVLKSSNFLDGLYKTGLALGNHYNLRWYNLCGIGMAYTKCNELISMRIYN